MNHPQSTGTNLLSLAERAVNWARARRRPGGERLAEAQAAIVICNVLLELVAHIQQHRGMSSAWLAGDPGFAARLVDKRAEIEPLFDRLQQLTIETGGSVPPCLAPAEVARWRQHWSLLVAELADSSIEKTLAIHSKLIAVLLGWLGATSEERIVQPASNVLPEGLVRNFTHRLPQLAETLGQARATGSAVAAQGRCPAVLRVRLMFLASRAESLTTQACAADRRGEFAAQQVRSLTLMLRTHMLGSPEIGVNAETYFAEATKAIDSVFAWLCECGRQLETAMAQAGCGLDEWKNSADVPHGKE
ncbi:MAG TPA: nitrate- and nitrite sensing domain-containing protein [Rhodocyclaceae bacterium]|nr:nitrate- and nitrite sensing domain-containing protein [Rhodocyclaceae bacterium]